MGIASFVLTLSFVFSKCPFSVYTLNDDQGSWRKKNREDISFFPQIYVVRVHMGMCVEGRSRFQVFSSIVLSTLVLSKGLSENLDLWILQVQLASKPQGSSCLWLPKPLGSILHGYWELNSGSHACTVNTLPTEPSPLPQDILSLTQISNEAKGSSILLVLFSQTPQVITTPPPKKTNPNKQKN